MGRVVTPRFFIYRILIEFKMIYNVLFVFIFILSTLRRLGKILLQLSLIFNYLNNKNNEKSSFGEESRILVKIKENGGFSEN